MAENRFKKSVDTATSKTKANIRYNILEKAPEQAKNGTLSDILENTKAREKRGGSHTFYLSADVSHTLNKLSKKTKKSKSSLVDEILKAFLFKP